MGPRSLLNTEFMWLEYSSEWRFLARSVLASLPLLGFAGCASPPADQSALSDVPAPAVFTARAETSEFRQSGWLNDFKDTQLNLLVAEALANNHDLRAAAARLASAQASRRITDSLRYPTVNATAGASRRNLHVEQPDGDLDERKLDSFDLGLNLIWELDLWGKLKNRTQAAMADFEAETALYRSAELSLAANTVKSWYRTVEAELLVALAEDTLRVFEANLAVVEGSFKRGLPDRALDVRLTRANVEAARGTVELRRRVRDAEGRALETLLGRYPADEILITTNLPVLTLDVPPGLPSELLRRRPDIVAAERRLAASLERVKVAKKDLLPTISLTAGAGTSSSDLRDLLDVERILWNVAGNLTQPVFQGGRLVAGIDLEDASSRERLALFSATILNAFLEVETFLAAESFLRGEELALRQAAAESIAAEDLAWQQYQRGLVDIITVLESQRRSFNARSSLINVVNARLQNRINLYLALGGDFGLDPVTTPGARLSQAAAGGMPCLSEGGTPPTEGRLSGLQSSTLEVRHSAYNVFLGRAARQSHPKMPGPIVSSTLHSSAQSSIRRR